jgi:hypothetical protein
LFGCFHGGDTLFFTHGHKVLCRKHEIIIPCRIANPNRQIEVLLCSPSGKTYESLLITNITPSEMQTALLAAGYKPLLDSLMPENEFIQYIKIQTEKLNSFSLFLYWKDSISLNLIPIEKFLLSRLDNGETYKMGWFFNGIKSSKGEIFSHPSLTYIAPYFDPYAIIMLNNSELLFKDIFTINPDITPPAGTRVELIIKPFKKKQP